MNKILKFKYLLIIFFTINSCLLAESEENGHDSTKIIVNKTVEIDSTKIKSNDAELQKVEVSQFVSPEVCGKCHTEIYEQWKGSMHSKAFQDPLWQAITKLFNADIKTEDEILAMKSCIKCHTPLGFRSGAISDLNFDYSKLAFLPSQGIFCNWCHNINEAEHIGDAGYKMRTQLGKEGIPLMLGPRKDAYTDSHLSKYSQLHTRSEFCGLCHNVSHQVNKLKIENTYDEWKDSPYNTGDPETSTHCQDCHMRQKPGMPVTGKTKLPDNPGKSAKDGKTRNHIWAHYFVGGNSIVPKILDSVTHSEMAIERLLNAADIEIIKEGNYAKGMKSLIKIKVINSGAGHYLPTGVTEIRQIWLFIQITDKERKILFKSGALNTNGKIENDSIIYNTIFGDKNGNPVINVAIAEKILYDYRIPPKSFKTENFFFEIPVSAISPIKIEAVLKYRTIDPDLLKRLLKEKAPEVPVIDMASKIMLIEF